MPTEPELLHWFRQAINDVNQRTGSQYTFVHGSGDGILEPRAEKWNATRVTTRAVGECNGATGHEPD